MNLFRYRRPDGVDPITDWLAGLRDKATQARMRIRLLRIEGGNLGDCEPVGDGVFELRIHMGPGYRVYFGRHGRTVVLLINGGDKSTQASDIVRAKAYWAEWKQRQK